TSAPASRSVASAWGSPRNSMPTRSRIVSALCSISSSPSSESTSTGFSVRVMNGTCSATAWSLAAWRAARPPLRLPALDSLTPDSSPWTRSRPTPPASLAPGAGARLRPSRKGHDGGQPLERVRRVRDAHRPDEVLLEPRLDGGLHLLDAANDLLDLGPRGPVEERDPRSRPGRVAGRAHAVEVAVRHEPQHQGVERVDVAAERPREADAVDPLHAEPVHEQPAPGVEGPLRELDRAHVVLGDDDPRLRPRQHVPERPPLPTDSRRARGKRPVDHPGRRDAPGEEHLRDRLDDPRPADPGHERALERRLVGPGLRADHAEPGLERLAVDPDALDRPGRRALPAADLGA